jgi:hypothetical protein
MAGPSRAEMQETYPFDVEAYSVTRTRDRRA